MINFYGSKSKIAHRYPAPKYDQIIEPFAGGASYSLLHCDKQVWLNDLDKRTIAIWQAILGLTIEEILQYIPEVAIAGEMVSDYLTPETPYGVEHIMRSAARTGTFGIKMDANVISPQGECVWFILHNRIRYWHPLIQHWKATLGDYRDLPNVEATWFIDPPYEVQQKYDSKQNHGGYGYLHYKIDYSELSEWCKSRRGQVIVCESVGASWLPFRDLCSVREYSRKMEWDKEVIWENG